MDPYVQINHGSVSFKTGADDDGGKTPKWGVVSLDFLTFEKFEFETEDPSDVLHCFVMDKGVTSDTIVTILNHFIYRLELQESGSQISSKMAAPLLGIPLSLRTNW